MTKKYVYRSLWLLPLLIILFFNQKLPVIYGKKVLVAQNDWLTGTDDFTMYNNGYFDYDFDGIAYNGKYSLISPDTILLDFFFPTFGEPTCFVLDNGYLIAHDYEKKEKMYTSTRNKISINVYQNDLVFFPLDQPQCFDMPSDTE